MLEALQSFYVDSTARVRVGSDVSKKVVFYGQEPPSGESTTTECGVNYQLLAGMY